MFERARRSLPPLCAALLLACGGGGGEAASSPPTPPLTVVVNGNTPASAHAWSTAAAMAKGINFGNMLEAPREGDWGVRADEEFIALVGDAARGGFTSAVRLPVRWSNHASADAQALIDPAFMARVDDVVTRLLARGVTVLMDMHHYRQLDGDALDPNEARVPDAVLQDRFVAMWRQIATRFAARSPQLVFELYNEPHGALEPSWNALIARTLPVVRESNPDRIVIVGPVQWNSARELPRLMIPNDANLVLTVHNYEPFKFTHQGAAWITPPLPTGVDCCDAEQQRRMTEPLDLARADSQRRKVPVFVGEFGAYSQAPQAARVRYLRLMRDAMAARELPWFYWELASGFGLYDPERHRFRNDLKDALYAP
jgi:endoglucanase